MAIKGRKKNEIKMRKILIILSLLIFSIQTVFARQGLMDNPKETKALHPKKLEWKFEGFFGSIDKASAQRGFQVYKEICSACHGIKLLAYRNLQGIGFTEEEVKYLASQYLVVDGPDEDGEMFERAALPSDRITGPFLNENQARSANGGALPVDLSLIIKARHDGPNYVYSLLNGYKDAPEEFELASGKNYNVYFEGRQISMPPPITDDVQIEYMDGTFASKEQMIIDVVNFLQYAAEPETEHRKQMGIRVIIFLSILMILLIIANRLAWKEVK